MKRALSEFRTATQPPAAAIRRVRSRLAAPARISNALRGSAVPRSAMARVRRGAASRARSRPSARLLVVAAALALAVVFVWQRGPAEVSQVLNSPAAWSMDRPTTSLTLHYMGSGTLAGTTRNVEVDWRVGTLTLALDPDAGTRLVVITPEGRATVKGTRFSVTRDATGTHVMVEQGSVAVACGGRPEALIGAGAGAHCLPRTSAGLLARSRALAADPAAALDAANAGLAVVGDDDVVRGELRVARIAALVALDRKRDALVEARRYLDADAVPRQQEIERVAAALALELEGCDGALPHLEALTGPDDGERAWLEHCEGVER